ncbi:DNA polymerase delta subunit 4 [Olea europaea subsp. europaea]|uniref:DNA polymerase delta subunit 4 n=1 Tax=Olea europaea subsp. europaea TaxID=158383 RepID=A0A8S0P8R9_OLEEU|nr:DNA polymerase delta subunit 4 [Olea europaea subsp. europaea]
MASSSDMKGFFRQKKKTAARRGVGKSKANKATSFKKPKNSASIGTDQVQPPALISHGALDLQDDCDSKEEVLRQFDMSMAYGPCLGMTRLDRWERAKALGLNPPKDVERLLRAEKVNAQCLWDGRI